MAIFILLWPLQERYEEDSSSVYRKLSGCKDGQNRYLKMPFSSFTKCLTAVQTCQRYSRNDA